MDSAVANIVDAILTAILQWRVAWLDEQKTHSTPPPICRTQPRKLKITYDNYKDYESTFVPLLMHEIWAQIFEAWSKVEDEIKGIIPMDIDDQGPAPGPSKPSSFPTNLKSQLPHHNHSPRQFWVGVVEYRTEGDYQCILKCQYLVESHKLNSHLKLMGEGDLVRIDLATSNEPRQNSQYNDYTSQPGKNEVLLSLFAYINDVSSQKVNSYTVLSEHFSKRPTNRNYHVINYQIIIAKRQLRLKLSEAMKITCLYYLKPMIRQVESVAILRESALASDILSPKKITCQLSIPTIVSIKSPYYNDMQYKAIIGANEALVRNIPKIQLIQGPPGTGKTHTLVGIIKHFYLNWRDTSKMPKVLICAPSNGAIDEVARRLHREREFLKKGPAKRSLRLVRVGHPDHISESIRMISLDELVETNANFKVDGVKKKNQAKITELEDELSKYDTEITNLRYTHREKEIPELEGKIGELLRVLDKLKSSEEVTTRREVSEASKRSMRYELIKNADVILTTLNSCQRHPLDSLFRNSVYDLSFHCVIVDEASQCCEPELLMPLCYKISKMILIGDPMQLPATVISRFAQDFDFGRSLFERFFIHFGSYDQSSPIAMLTEQYRMHPEICHFPSKQFYDARLVSARPIMGHHPLKPYVMFDLRHSSENKSGKSNSLENEIEAAFIRNLLIAVLTKAPENSSVGVITPYKGQRRLLTHKIDNLKLERNIKIDVNTCDGFQGQEKDIIILSCVRAFEHGGSVGFLKSSQRVNVALTRAKHCLIVCISAKSLSKDKTWEALIEDARSRQFIHTLTQTPMAPAIMDMIKNVSTSTSATSRLIRTNGAPDGTSSFVPEYIMPMDID